MDEVDVIGFLTRLDDRGFLGEVKRVSNNASHQSQPKANHLYICPASQHQTAPLESNNNNDNNNDNNNNDSNCHVLSLGISTTSVSSTASMMSRAAEHSSPSTGSNLPLASTVAARQLDA